MIGKRIGAWIEKYWPRIVFKITGLIVLTIACGVFIWLVARLLYELFYVSSVAEFLFGTSETANGEYAKFLANIVGGIIIAVGLYYNAKRTNSFEKQVAITEKGNVDERFKNAIEHLGSDKSAIVLGGIHALHRIAREVESYRKTVFDILCSYIRDQTADGAGEKPTIVIQTILDILFKDPSEKKEEYIYGSYVAQLEGSHLMRANLEKAHLKGADLFRAQLEDAHLSQAHLEDADLSFAHLERASLTEAHLEHARLNLGVLCNADFKDADLRGAQLEVADLRDAHLEGANLSGAHLESADLYGAHLEGVDLREAHLKGADLRETHLELADLKHAKSQGAILSDFQLQEIENSLIPQSSTSNE